MKLPAPWLRPEWQAEGVGALMTTRQGGVGIAPFDTFNLRAGIGDELTAVAENQRRLAASIGATPVYLEQVHGIDVARLTGVDLRPGAATHRADASVTTEPGLACTVQVADCLPILFAAPQARAVGAAHAGWRGLAAGVVEATLAQVCAAGRCRPGEVRVWLGACIGPQAFEVGADVLAAFGASAKGSPRFVPNDAAKGAAKGAAKWFADLPGLARDRLHACGVQSISGGEWCTVSSPSRFFSFRRDGVTGRMAAAIWIDHGRVG